MLLLLTLLLAAEPSAPDLEKLLAPLAPTSGAISHYHPYVISNRKGSTGSQRLV